jgi:di/tricarboxylate transporter
MTVALFLGLSTPELLLVAIIVAAIALIASNAIRADIVALLVLLALGLTRVLPVDQALSGFSWNEPVWFTGSRTEFRSSRAKANCA